MTVNQLCTAAKAAAPALANASAEKRNAALRAMSASLRKNAEGILKANELDLAAARECGTPGPMLDRLALTRERVEAIAEATEKVISLPDPLGTIKEITRPNGLLITKKAVPFGLIAIIYESRPNVTADAAALCVKSGNAVVLRGGSEAINSNIAIASALSAALERAGLPGECVSMVEDVSRDGAYELMRMRGVVDLLIPRGGRALIRSVLDNSSVPVIETGAGNCHIYFDDSADTATAIEVLDNAKRSRPSVCNAAESLLIARSRAAGLLPLVRERLDDVELRADAESREILPMLTPASEDDFFAEYNDMILSVKIVGDVREAVAHINSHGTHHSDCIITKDPAVAEYFLNNVDSAAVYLNASTRFTDGGEFGFGAEIGISTQKTHARGPMGLKEMTTYKYIVRGDGQVRI